MQVIAMLTILEHVAMLVETGVTFSGIVLVSMTQATTARSLLQKVRQNRGGAVCKRMRRLLIGKSAMNSGQKADFNDRRG